jgi:hypothetical protein
VLCRQAGRGVRVSVAVLDDGINIGAGKLNFARLSDIGGKVYRIPPGTSRRSIMHHKFCVIDRATVILGSYNWTKQAQSNDENITVVTGAPDFAVQYLDGFNALLGKHGLTTPAVDAEQVRRRLEVVRNLLLLGDQDMLSAQLDKVRPATATMQLAPLFEALDADDSDAAVAWIDDLCSIGDGISDTLIGAAGFDSVLPDTPLEFQEALGPAPLHATKHSRMSPPGISHRYVSESMDTCMSEIQPNVGREVWIARFSVAMDIKVLDLTGLPSIKVPSIFGRDYNSQLAWAPDFLRDFVAEIGQPPKNNDNLLEYIPTQVLAEYIRAQGYQGIKYNSAQHLGGINYVLYCSPDADPAYYHKTVRPLFHEWLRIEEVSRTRVTGLAVSFSTFGNSSVDPLKVPLASDFDDGERD